jgi:hypothetical protein
MIPGVRIHEEDRVIRGTMRVTMRRDIPIRSPAITDERCAGFDPSTDNVRQCVAGSARYDTGTKNILPDSRSTPPPTHWPFTGCPLWYFRRPNLLSSISTVLLGPPIFSEQPSNYTSSVSLQNIPQSAIVGSVK